MSDSRKSDPLEKATSSTTSMYAGGGVGRTGSTREAFEQRRAISGGERGGKLFEQGEHRRGQHAPDTSRVSVSQGLRGVREAAHRDKKQKFTARLHHVTTDLLRDSFYSLRGRQRREWTG